MSHGIALGWDIQRCSWGRVALPGWSGGSGWLLGGWLRTSSASEVELPAVGWLPPDPRDPDSGLRPVKLCVIPVQFGR